MTEFVAEMYHSKGFRFRSTTSHPARNAYYKKNKTWVCVNQGRQINTSKTGLGIGGASKNRYTTAWEYIGNR